MSRIEYHQNHPDISTDDYAASCHEELGKSVSQRARVYLDTKYWVILRDVVLNRSNVLEAPSLLEALRKGVKSKQIICPLSESTFLELMKQNDPATRLASASLVDELSEGVCLRPTMERANLEMQHFLSASLGKGNLPPLETLVWSKVSYALGVTHPSNSIFPPEVMQAVQKAFFDQMWELSMTSMESLLAGSQPPSDNFEGAVERINTESARYAPDLRSFKDAYRAEVRGYMGLFMRHARQLIEELKPAPTTPTSEQAIEFERMLLNLFAAAIEKPDIPKTLRTFHIGASCHAAVRWDKKRKLEANDLYDFHHAEAAMAYCDAFLTEKSLKTMLSQKHLGLLETFKCQPLAGCQEALTWVTGVNNS